MSDFIGKMIDEAENKARKEGRDEGRELGMREQAKNTAIKLKLMGESVDMIADLIGYSPETVNGWLSSDTATPVTLSR